MSKLLTFKTQVEVFGSLDELPADQRELLEHARATMEHAYAPYSKFRVGAAVRLANGAIVVGSNQENAAYPSGLCAERVAVFAASAQHPGIAIKQIAVTAASERFSLGQPVSPCGACRQVLKEYEDRDRTPMVILLASQEKAVYRLENVEQILPLSFTRRNLPEG